MTQKELLYLEDACKHEEILLDVLDDALNTLNDESFLDSIQTEISIHQRLLDNLNQLLEDKANE